MKFAHLVLALAAVSGAVDLRLSGSVYDSSGRPLMGARVRLVPAGLWTASDPRGGWVLAARLDSARAPLPETLLVSWTDGSDEPSRTVVASLHQAGIVSLLDPAKCPVAAPAPAGPAAELRQAPSAPSAPAEPPDIEDSTLARTGVVGDARDGRTYRWIRIGRRLWFAQDLAWAAPGSWWYGRTDTASLPGRLYRGESLAGLCPEGWRVPSARDWAALERKAGGQDLAGRALRSRGGWNGWTGSVEGGDRLGFDARPGGYRHRDGSFEYLGSAGFWWVAPDPGSGPTNRSIRGGEDRIRGQEYSARFGFAVRCVRDDERSAR